MSFFLLFYASGEDTDLPSTSLSITGGGSVLAHKVVLVVTVFCVDVP